MRPFTTLTAVALPLPMANVDTDQLLPARFLKEPRTGGHGRFLLHDLRFDEAGRPLGRLALDDPAYAGAEILVARRNFATGSSREAAVYALADFGIRAVVAPSFGDIFTSNAVKNGLLPARVDEAAADRLLAVIKDVPGCRLTIDLPAGEILLDGERIPLSILPNHKDQLVNGWDDIDLTLRHQSRIDAYAAADTELRPWARPRRPDQSGAR